MTGYNYWIGVWHKLRGHTLALHGDHIRCTCDKRWQKPCWWSAPW